jgi:hypothetical protein
LQAATKVQITLIPDAQPKSLHGPCQKQTFVRKPGASRPGGPEEHDGKVTDLAPPPQSAMVRIGSSAGCSVRRVAVCRAARTTPALVGETGG